MSPLGLAIPDRNARAELKARQNGVFIRVSDISGVGTAADARNVLASVRKLTRLEFEGISVVATLAVGEVTSAKCLDAVMAGAAALFGRFGEVHRHRGSTHLTAAGPTADAVTTRAAHPLIDVERVAKADAVRAGRLGCTREAALLVADVAGGHRVRRVRAVAGEARVVCRRT